LALLNHSFHEGLERHMGWMILVSLKRVSVFENGIQN
jgi:hypothetical protein